MEKVWCWHERQMTDWCFQSEKKQWNYSNRELILNIELCLQNEINSSSSSERDDASVQQQFVVSEGPTPTMSASLCKRSNLRPNEHEAISSLLFTSLMCTWMFYCLMPKLLKDKKRVRDKKWDPVNTQETPECNMLITLFLFFFAIVKYTNIRCLKDEKGKETDF